MLLACKHKFCQLCVQQLPSNLSDKTKYCELCGVWLPVNQIVNVVQNEDAQPEEIVSARSLEGKETKSMYSVMTENSRIISHRHQEKPIEYFCRDCHQLVCVRCMF